MDLDTLTAAMNDFVASKGWLAPDSPKKQSSRNLAISLVLEASEVLEHFQWREDVVEPDGAGGKNSPMSCSTCCSWPASMALTWARL